MARGRFRFAVRYIGRQVFGSKRLNRRSNGRRDGYDSLFDAAKDINNARGGYLDDNLWEEAYTDVIDSQKDKAGNAGQETLLGDDYFANHAKDYCRTNGKDYNPEDFISYVQNHLGDEYYNAISEITEECANELYEAWDQSYAGDNIGEKMFGDYTPKNNRVYGSTAGAAAAYRAAAIRNGYKAPTSAANRQFNSEKNRQSLISRFGTGPTKAWKSGDSIRNNPGYSAYRQAALRNGKTLRP
jgi:hypothetical protein